VLTARILYKKVRLEASGFYGSEPDESRWIIDYGLDRIPEVRTLRQKLGILCQQDGRCSGIQHWPRIGSQDHGKAS
jgi:hypothetical protein